MSELAQHAASHKLSLPTILQEDHALIGGKSPVYWAVAKLGTAPPEAYTTAQAVLAAAAPLSRVAASDVRAAALIAGDQRAWATVRSWTVPTPGQELILLGEAAGRSDTVAIGPSMQGADAFVASFEIPLFRKRIQLTQRVSIDFFAKRGFVLSCIEGLSPTIRTGRLFSLTLFEVPTSGMPKRKGRPTEKKKKKKAPEPGSWVVSISLLEPSESTPISARFTIDPTSPAGQGPVDLFITPPPGWTLGAEDDPKKKIADEAYAPIKDCMAGVVFEAEYVSVH
jgi:hypothetical protein